MRGTVTQENKGGAGFPGGIQALSACGFDGFGGDGLGDGFLVGIDDRGVRTDLAQKRLCDGDRLELAAISFDRFAHLVILCAVHQMRRLNNEILDAIGDRTLKRLIHVVDLLAVASLNVVDDDLRGEGSADGPVGVGFLKCVLDALDVGHTAVIVGRAEGNDEQLVFADVVLIPRIVLRCVAGVKTEIVGAGVFPFDERLLRVRQRIPRGFGRFALGVGLVGAGLDIDRVDQSSDLVGGLPV